MNLSLGNIPLQNKPVFKSKIHILDGGTHSNQMEHFAKSVFRKMNHVDDLQMHTVECCKKAPELKRLDSLQDTLNSLNSSGQLKKGDYVTMLGLVTVPVLNLQDRLKAVLNYKTTLNFRNVKAQKAMLMRYLEAIYKSSDKYAQEVRYMDGVEQKMEYSFGVIKILNELASKGIRVFLPAGHGADNTTKWLAGERGVKDELYNFIATGNDKDNAVRNLQREIDKRNFYDFNLLSLSDAKIVNVLGKDKKEYIFSAKDGFVNTQARGVYNFSPIRNANGEILGYGFHDETTVDFPHKAFDKKERVKELNKFVGLPFRDCIADNTENKRFQLYNRFGLPVSGLPDKLYKITDIYGEKEIEARKLDLLGQFVNREGKLVFDVNPKGQVVFNKTNCEGSERPSVYSMWGSCFATVNAIKNDIIMQEYLRTNPLYQTAMFIKRKISQIAKIFEA